MLWLALLLTYVVPEPLEASERSVVSQTIPEVSATTPVGVRETISQYRGSVVVLDVWAAWCAPCVAEIPSHRELVRKLGKRGLIFVSANADADPTVLRRFLLTHPMPWKHWLVGGDRAFRRKLDVRSYPTLFVLDRRGIIRHKNIRGKRLEAAVEKLLKEEK